MKETEKEKQYERLLNIKTTGRDDTKSDTIRYPYEPTPYCVLERLANSGYINKRNVLLDYGSGKGRVDFFLAYQTRCNAIGIEYDDRMYNVALENKKQSTVGDRVEFKLIDATNYEVAAGVDRIFFFNPFSIELLHKIVAKVVKSYYDNIRKILLFFYFPSTEYVAYLVTHDNLEFVDEIECDDLFDENKSRERIMIFRVI